MPTVKAGNRICQPITQANCRRDSRTGSRSMVDLLLPSATRRTTAPHPRAQGYSDAAAKASPPHPEQLSLALNFQEVEAAHDLDRPFRQARMQILQVSGQVFGCNFFLFLNISGTTAPFVAGGTGRRRRSTASQARYQPTSKRHGLLPSYSNDRWFQHMANRRARHGCRLQDAAR